MPYSIEYRENRKTVYGKKSYDALDDARKAAVSVVKRSGNKTTVHIVYGAKGNVVGQVDAYDNFGPSIVYGYTRWSEDGDPKIWKINPANGKLVKNLGTLDYSWD